MSMLSKAVGKVTKSLFGGGSSSTYSAPDLSVLQTAAPTVNYDFLRTAAGDAGKLASQGKTYQDYIKTTTPNADNYFQDYINSINAPSSVDQVQSQLNNEKLTNTLANIERDTNQRFGSTIMDQYLRGLTGGGAASDIAGSALASVAAAGGRAAADARTSLYQSELDRAAEREKAAREAYGTRYTTGANADITDKQLQAQLAEGAAQGYNSLLSTGAGNQASLLDQYAAGLKSEADREMQRRLGLAGQLTAGAANQAQNTQKNPGIIPTILGNTRLSFGFGGGGG